MLSKMNRQQPLHHLEDIEEDKMPVDNQTDTNQLAILCPYCGSVVLHAGNAAPVETELVLHRPHVKDEQFDTYDEVWLVDDQDRFVNLGVTRIIDNRYKYLICADCDQGPFGATFSESPDLFYIAHRRVIYEAERESQSSSDEDQRVNEDDDDDDKDQILVEEE